MSKFLLPLLLVSNLATFGQDARTSTLSFGVGGLPHSGTFQKSGAAFTGDYEYRVWKYLAVEAGTDIFLPSYFTQKAVNFIDIPPGKNLVSVGQNLMGSVSTSEPSRIALVTYGFRGILPLFQNRLELFVGLGGGYAWNSEFRGNLNTALGQASAGARMALDSDHRFWLGTTVRGYSNFKQESQDWVSWTLDLGIRFGH